MRRRPRDATQTRRESDCCFASLSVSRTPITPSLASHSPGCKHLRQRGRDHELLGGRAAAHRSGLGDILSNPARHWLCASHERIELASSAHPCHPASSPAQQLTSQFKNLGVEQLFARVAARVLQVPCEDERRAWQGDLSIELTREDSSVLALHGSPQHQSQLASALLWSNPGGPHSSAGRPNYGADQQRSIRRGADIWAVW